MAKPNARYLGTFSRTSTKDESIFYSHSFVQLDDETGEATAVFSETSDDEHLVVAGDDGEKIQIRPGATCVLEGFAFEVAVDEDGEPILTKQGQAVLRTRRTGNEAITFLSPGGLTLRKGW